MAGAQSSNHTGSYCSHWPFHHLVPVIATMEKPHITPAPPSPDPIYRVGLRVNLVETGILPYFLGVLPSASPSL